MNSKAIYWIALGAFALGLHSEYQRGNLPPLQRVADRAEATLCRLASRAEQTLAMARVLSRSPQPEIRVKEDWMAGQQVETDRVMAKQQARLNREFALRQAELNRAMALRQADLARTQARLDRMQIVLERARLIREHALERAHFDLANAPRRRTSVLCPGTNLSIKVPVDLPEIDVDVPEVEVGDSF
jgi:hypothetical protein